MNGILVDETVLQVTLKILAKGLANEGILGGLSGGFGALDEYVL